MNIRKRDVYIDPWQGITEADRAFGFVALRGASDYQGWFFKWPGAEPVARTERDRADVLASLDVDSEAVGCKRIPFRWAYAALAAYLACQVVGFQEVGS